MPKARACTTLFKVSFLALILVGTSACSITGSALAVDLDDLCSSPSAVSRIEIVPSSELRVRVGEVANVEARVLNEYESPFFVCPPPIFVHSADGAIASVAGGGPTIMRLTVRGRKVGETVVRIRAGGIQDSLRVIVTSDTLSSPLVER